ncbi:MAG: hypothetical protein ABI353_04095 [Isosphaeraceae bacterium]
MRIGGEQEDTEVHAPLFCARCRRGADDLSPLCPHCGETRQAQGFCTVCEAYWRLPAGADCPKHDLPLEAARPPDESLLALGERPDWITVGRFGHPMQAEAPRLRLEAEGIPTFVDGARMGDNSIYQGATGGVQLQVPRSLVHEARVLLAQSWAPIIPEDDDDLDDAWEELAPDPGARLRTLMRGAMILVLVLSVLRGLALLFER